MKKTAISVTFANYVTRDQLIESLDRILNIYGCPSCGLNGWGVFLGGDPDPLITQVRGDLIHEKINPVINVEHFNQNFGQIERFNQG